MTTPTQPIYNDCAIAVENRALHRHNAAQLRKKLRFLVLSRAYLAHQEGNPCIIEEANEEMCRIIAELICECAVFEWVDAGRTRLVITDRGERELAEEA